ncbi:hypothetical protein BN11_2530004 [Nostocoides australiense Ben110]|uniref:Uncharacterized protein n=1 Tax=Nostocoides australiense Ben110 TaxID=1193182 RepID=W6JV17_9MICO|nr:hypothetical protein BN11_2530004 [Tetrasphaera australiensis Ben110]
MPQPPDPQDSRAILNPGVMAERVRFERFAAPEEFAGILDWCWSVEWEMQPGESHAQETLSLPAVNISVGTTPPPGPHPPPRPYAVSPRVVGVATRRTTRVLSGSGWNVAAKASVGGGRCMPAGSPICVTWKCRCVRCWPSTTSVWGSGWPRRPTVPSVRRRWWRHLNPFWRKPIRRGCGWRARWRASPRWRRTNLRWCAWATSRHTPG